MDMKRGNRITAILMVMLLFVACGNNQKETEASVYDEALVDEHIVPDSAEDIVEEEVPMVDEAPSRVAVSSSSSSSDKSGGYDNMRGFDPASEDDMDDNGMSRYMENDDEEGWE